MPLTPAEVHNVAFKKPPIGKRGYDEEEVDAFLDIVEVELSRLIEENNDLRAGAAGEAPAPVPAAEEGGASAAELSAARAENARMQSHIAELERASNQGQDDAPQQVVQLQQQLTQTEEQLAENRRELERAQRAVARAQGAGGQDGVAAEQATQAVGVLVLAQQTADGLLTQSKAEAERLVRDGQTNAENALNAAQEASSKHVGEAEARATQLDEESSARAEQTIKQAEQQAAKITAEFEQRRVALERRVEELRTFEREYRSRLKSYLESQLRDLDAAPPGANNEYAEAQQS